MAETDDEGGAVQKAARGRAPDTLLLALTGVMLAVGGLVAVVLTVAMVLYFVV